MPYANIEAYRAYQRIYQREWSRRNRDKRLEYERSWIDRNRDKKRKYIKIGKVRCPIKTWCRNTLARAINQGKLIRKACEICGNPESQGHHDDYTKPLMVRWMCRIHHLELHRKYK